MKDIKKSIENKTSTQLKFESHNNAHPEIQKGSDRLLLKMSSSQQMHMKQGTHEMEISHNCVKEPRIGLL